MISFPECITWLAVGLTESVAIVTLNIITLIVFIKKRNLRKRSTYLIINLAVVDMLAGGGAAYGLFYFVGVDCNIWRYSITDVWASNVLVILYDLYPLCSLTNISAISLERLHATLRPFRHRVIKKLVYVLTIATVWVTAGLLSISARVLLKFRGPSYYRYLLNSFIAICLIVICVSYGCIVIKVRCGAQPQNHGAASRERKLTTTLFIVTVASLLLYLPTVFHGLLSSATGIRKFYVLSALFCANSLVNPILYAIRMPDYRSAVLALFRRRPQQQRQVEVFPLNDM